MYYDDLTADSVQTLAEYSKQEGMQTLKKINRKARQLQNRDKHAKDARYRMNFGLYFYDEEEPQE